MKIIMRKVTLVAMSLMLFAGVFSSCSNSDFLNLKPYTEGDTNNDYYKDKANLRASVDALNRFTSEESITGRGYMWLENASDNMTTGRDQAQATQIKNFTMGASNGRDWNENWEIMYQIIASANELIKATSDLKLTGEDRDFVLGNAYFYRGLSYLWLAPWHGDDGPNGGIPIITEKTPVRDMDMSRPKSVLANYDQIISDMDAAAEHLPLLSQQNESDYGRPWKAAAWGLAARAALYAAQFDQSYYEKVIVYCDKIMGLSGADKRALYPDITKLFTAPNNFSSEYIFSFLGSAKVAAGPKFHGMSGQNGGWGRFNTWGYFAPTVELYESFENGDLRRANTIGIPGDDLTFLDLNVRIGEPDTKDPKKEKYELSADTKMLFVKWLSPYRYKRNAGVEYFPNGNFMCTTLGQVVVRYADVMLMKAEALIWLRGEGNGEAKELLNAIRTRAGLPANSHATKADLKRERRNELAFEFNTPRWMDIMRWRDFDLLRQPLHGFDIDHYLKTYNSQTQKGELKKKEVWAARNFNPEKNKVFPIPQAVIDKSKNLKQNIGY